MWLQLYLFRSQGLINRECGDKDFITGFNNLGIRAVACVERICRAAVLVLTDLFRHSFHKVGVCTAEAIDGLFVVTHPYRAVNNFGKIVEDLDLNRGGVLELIDKQIFVFITYVLCYIRHVEQAQEQFLHVVIVDQMLRTLVVLELPAPFLGKLEEQTHIFKLQVSHFF